jgi:pimeloyl-ACP methyl ester carboxylesterase
MPEVSVREDVVHFQDTLKANRRTLLFLHGAGGSHHTFRDQWAELKGAARLLIPDLPGHAGSGGKPFETISESADWVRDFAKQMGLSRFLLVGHSMGGAIAIQTALNRLSGIEALILVGTGARLKISPAIFEGIAGRYREFAPELVELMMSPESSPDLRDDVLRDVLSTRPETYLADFRACNGFDVMPRLGEIRVPTLVINGDADRLTPLKYGEYLATNIPGAVLKILHGVGHLAMLERPNQLNAVITSFIQSLDR